MRKCPFVLGTIATAAGLLFLPIGTISLVAAGSPNATAREVVAVERTSSRDPVSQAAARLNSPRFAEREAASQELTVAQAPAVAALLAVAKEGSLEAAVRSVGILEVIYVSSGALEESTAEQFWSTFDDLVRAYLWVDLREAQATADAAEFALDELERTGRPAVADRADVVLESHYEIRERRAVFEIERLHGKAIFGSLSYPASLERTEDQWAGTPAERTSEGRGEGPRRTYDGDHRPEMDGGR